MKRFFLLFLINAAIASVAAIPDKDLVVITSGATSTSGLKSIRRITFENGVMLVDMKDGSSTCWNTDWVNCVMFGEKEQETTIEAVAHSTYFEVKENILFINGCAPTKVQLCACDGKVVFDDICNGNFTFDMGSLPSGMYLLKLDGNIHKIMNR